MKRLATGLLALVTALAVAGCGTSAQNQSETTSSDTGKDEITLGLSFPSADHGWLGAVIQFAQDEAKAQGVNFQVTTGDSPSKQTSDIEDLITKKVDAVVMQPMETDALTPAAEEVADAGIPLIIFDREVNTDKYTKLIKGDNYGIGQNAGKFIVDKLGGKGDVVIISGNPSSVTTLRTQGFMDAIKGTEINVLADQPGDFQKEKSCTVMQNLLQAHSHIDAVYTEDDEMALGVLQAIREANRTDIKIVTGAGGAKDFYKEIKDSTDMTLATFTYAPDMVKNAVDEAIKIAKGEKVTEKDTTLPAEQVDSSNVDQYYDPNSLY